MGLTGKRSGPERALIAVGLGGSAVVVATDGRWIAADIDSISDGAEDIGLDYPSGPGLWLWEGEGREALSGPPDEPDEIAVEYEGRLRRVEPHEAAALLAMTPPEEPSP